jgi:hypothetical protein
MFDNGLHRFMQLQEGEVVFTQGALIEIRWSGDSASRDADDQGAGDHGGNSHRGDSVATGMAREGLL